MSNIPHHSDTKEKALSYLSKGVAPSAVADALGVTPAVISQFLSDEVFAAELATRRFEVAEKHNKHDDILDETEAALIKKARELIPMITRPLEVIRAASIINGMKRRGAGAAPETGNAPVVVQLSLPMAIMSRFTLNSHNQVIAAGNQELVTIQSNKVADLISTEIPSQSRENQYAHNSLSGPSAETDRRISRPKITSDTGSEEFTKVKYERIDEFGFDYQNQSL